MSLVLVPAAPSTDSHGNIDAGGQSGWQECLEQILDAGGDFHSDPGTDSEYDSDSGSDSDSGFYSSSDIGDSESNLSDFGPNGLAVTAGRRRARNNHSAEMAGTKPVAATAAATAAAAAATVTAASSSTSINTITSSSRIRSRVAVHSKLVTGYRPHIAPHPSLSQLSYQTQQHQAQSAKTHASCPSSPPPPPSLPFSPPPPLPSVATALLLNRGDVGLASGSTGASFPYKPSHLVSASNSKNRTPTPAATSANAVIPHLAHQLHPPTPVSAFASATATPIYPRDIKPHQIHQTHQYHQHQHSVKVKVNSATEAVATTTAAGNNAMDPLFSPRSPGNPTSAASMLFDPHDQEVIGAHLSSLPPPPDDILHSSSISSASAHQPPAHHLHRHQHQHQFGVNPYVQLAQQQYEQSQQSSQSLDELFGQLTDYSRLILTPHIAHAYASAASAASHNVATATAAANVAAEDIDGSIDMIDMLKNSNNSSSDDQLGYIWHGRNTASAGEYGGSVYNVSNNGYNSNPYSNTYHSNHYQQQHQQQHRSHNHINSQLHQHHLSSNKNKPLLPLRSNTIHHTGSGSGSGINSSNNKSKNTDFLYSSLNAATPEAEKRVKAAAEREAKAIHQQLLRPGLRRFTSQQAVLSLPQKSSKQSSANNSNSNSLSSSSSDKKTASAGNSISQVISSVGRMGRTRLTGQDYVKNSSILPAAAAAASIVPQRSHTISKFSTPSSDMSSAMKHPFHLSSTATPVAVSRTVPASATASTFSEAGQSYSANSSIVSSGQRGLQHSLSIDTAFNSVGNNDLKGNSSDIGNGNGTGTGSDGFGGEWIDMYKYGESPMQPPHSAPHHQHRHQHQSHFQHANQQQPSQYHSYNNNSSAGALSGMTINTGCYGGNSFDIDHGMLPSSSTPTGATFNPMAHSSYTHSTSAPVSPVSPSFGPAVHSQPSSSTMHGGTIGDLDSSPRKARLSLKRFAIFNRRKSGQMVSSSGDVTPSEPAFSGSRFGQFLPSPAASRNGSLVSPIDDQQHQHQQNSGRAKGHGWKVTNHIHHRHDYDSKTLESFFLFTTPLNDRVSTSSFQDDGYYRPHGYSRR